MEGKAIIALILGGLLAGSLVQRFFDHKAAAPSRILACLPFLAIVLGLLLGVLLPVQLQQVAQLTALIGLLVTLGLLFGDHHQFSIKSLSLVALFSLTAVFIPDNVVGRIYLLGVSIILLSGFQMVSMVNQGRQRGLLDTLLLAMIPGLSIMAALIWLISSSITPWLLDYLILTQGLIVFVLSVRQRGANAVVAGSADVERQVRQERERIYRNLHDDIGARLLSLIYKAKSPEEADTVRCLLHDLRDSVAQTVQMQVGLSEFVADQREEVNARLEIAGISANWPSIANLPDMPLHPQWVAHMRRSVRELVSNVIKHSGANELWVEVVKDNDALQIILSDDGCGLSENAREGRGMHNLRKRMATIGSEISWTAREQGGTRVTMVLPMRN
ncbi:MAG: sensor histidine kinase [bacterium]